MMTFGNFSNRLKNNYNPENLLQITNTYITTRTKKCLNTSSNFIACEK